MSLLIVLLAFAPPTAAQPSSTNGRATTEQKADKDIDPLASKEEMIRDRFHRFEDRVYRLRDALEVGEPGNATRLERVLQRAGELGIADRLDDMIELLHNPSSLQTATDAQAQWLSDIDRLLAILMERDSDNQERQQEIDRLDAYRRKVGEILGEQKELRDATAQDALKQRLGKQLGDAIKRVNALLERQERLSQDTQRMGDQQKGPGEASARDSSAKSKSEELSDSQDNLSRDTQQLAEDLKRLGEPKSDQKSQDPADASARNKSQAAAESAQSAAGAMSQASESIKQASTSAAGEQQSQAAEALREAKKKLEEAQRQLEEQTQPQAKAEKQQQLAEKTDELSQQMQQDGQPQDGSQGQPGQQSGGKPGSSTPGQQNLDQAQSEMKNASKSLEKSKPGDAKPKQDKAIEQLEQAKKELEEALNQLRTEEREETLRDLESRFREMLSKQRAINESTIRIAEIDRDNFKRPEQLELAELSTAERALSQDAATCLHILDEDGTTVAFPRVVEQLSDDMKTVAQRLGDLRVGTLTQTIESEIVDTLEQLLEAVQRMQQENEQQGQQGGRPQEQGPEPLLPESAEFKLLRASQVRVNKRTTVLEAARVEETESGDDLTRSLQKVARRQQECAEIAQEMRDRQQRP